jgi:hypothetical protein
MFAWTSAEFANYSQQISKQYFQLWLISQANGGGVTHFAGINSFFLKGDAHTKRLGQDGLIMHCKGDSTHTSDSDTMLECKWVYMSFHGFRCRQCTADSGAYICIAGWTWRAGNQMVRCSSNTTHRSWTLIVEEEGPDPVFFLVIAKTNVTSYLQSPGSSVTDSIPVPSSGRRARRTHPDIHIIGQRSMCLRASGSELFFPRFVVPTRDNNVLHPIPAFSRHRKNLRCEGWGAQPKTQAGKPQIN